MKQSAHASPPCTERPVCLQVADHDASHRNFATLIALAPATVGRPLCPKLCVGRGRPAIRRTGSGVQACVPPRRALVRGLQQGRSPQSFPDNVTTPTGRGQRRSDTSHGQPLPHWRTQLRSSRRACQMAQPSRWSSTRCVIVDLLPLFATFRTMSVATPPAYAAEPSRHYVAVVVVRTRRR